MRIRIRNTDLNPINLWVSTSILIEFIFLIGSSAVGMCVPLYQNTVSFPTLKYLGTGQRGVTEAPSYTTAVVTRQTRSFLPENLLPVAEVFGPEGHPEHVHLTIRVDVPRQGYKFSAFFLHIFGNFCLLDPDPGGLP